VSIDKVESHDCYGITNIIIILNIFVWFLILNEHTFKFLQNDAILDRRRCRDFHVTLKTCKTEMSGQVVVTTKDRLNKRGDPVDHDNISFKIKYSMIQYEKRK
jgi:hypothetical protein